MRSYKSNSYSCAFAVAQYCRNSSRVRYSDLITGDLSFYNSKLVSKNGEESVFELNVDNMENRKGTLYNGKITKTDINRHRAAGRAFLSLEFSRYLKPYLKKMLSCLDADDTPVIYIEDGRESIQLAIRLDSAFRAEYYYSSVFADNRSHFLEGAIYIPADILNDYIKYYSFRNGCDLVFAVVSELPHDNQNICIRVNDNLFHILAGGKTKVVSDFESLISEIEEYYS